MSEITKSDLLSVEQTAQILACSASTVRNLLKQGKLPVLRFGTCDRVVRIHKGDVLTFIETNRSTINKES